MLPNLKDKFLTDSAQKAENLVHRDKIAFNIGKYQDAVKRGKQQFENLPLARQLAKQIKWNSLENLDILLEQFEKNFTDNQGKVIWANSADDALKAILQICKNHKAQTVVKSKSMVTEEIHLNEFLEKNQITAIETDLGEYIQQLDGEPPYHIVTPAMHKSKEDVAKLFHEKLNVAPHLSPEELTQVAREKLRAQFTAAEIGITGANFLVADIGGVCLTENEGNARLSTSFPKVHIAIVGIEKIIPSAYDLNLYWPLLSTFGTGQQLTVYNTILTGPRAQGENDGPQEMYVILLNNGRTQLLEPEFREALYCIRCGSCLNACPVYRNIGGHSYNTTYSGPIGAVITPHLKSMGDYGHLSFASSLCGNCTEVCPVNIQLHTLLLKNRIAYQQEGYSKLEERWAWRLASKMLRSRKLINCLPGKWKNKLFTSFVQKVWGEKRAPVHFPNQSFNKQWKRKSRGNKN